MELRDALSQISEIREQVAHAELFRGYRALPVAFSGLLAFATAGVQAAWLPDPVQNISTYLFLWVGAALISMLATGIEMALHCHYSDSTLDRVKTWLAIRQFMPSIVAGGVLTFVMVKHVPEGLWMLPGLWAMFFSLGIFASHRLLPPAVFWVGVYYMAAGAFCLILAQGQAALSPWAMGVPFGVGQLLAAAVLYWTLERNHGEN
jgi:hypothetical protein